MPRTAIQHKSSTLGGELMNTATQIKRGHRFTANSSSQSGEGGTLLLGQFFSCLCRVD
jgi:hypothetical protein